jgi:hypothetical protein
MKVLVYDNRSGRMERYELDEKDPMPYVANATMTVDEFRGKSASSIIWTDRRAMEAWNRTRGAWGSPIYIGYAFRRIGENGHAAQSQHYAGVSFDVAQNLGNDGRRRLRELAARLGVWGYIEPASLTPTWVHFDARQGPPACSAGYPTLKNGSRGVYVCVLQDALSTLGVELSAIDGVFGPSTKAAVMAYQRANGLTADGIVGCGTWRRLTAAANGLTRNSGRFPATYIDW